MDTRSFYIVWFWVDMKLYITCINLFYCFEDIDTRSNIFMIMTDMLLVTRKQALFSICRAMSAAKLHSLRLPDFWQRRNTESL